VKFLLITLLAGLASFGVRADDYSECFIPGEISEYKVSWMGLPLAWSKITTETLTEEGRELIRIKMVSKNYKAYTRIYKVDNTTEVILDPKTALPIRLDVRLNEGSRIKSHLTTFYHDKKVAIFQDRITKDIKEVEIHADTKEVLGFLYSVRNQELKILASQTHTLFVDGKLHELNLSIRRDGTIKLPNYGKIPSTEIEPIAEFDGLFIREGKIMFWISKQKRRA